MGVSVAMLIALWIYDGMSFININSGCGESNL
jgi:hypothetical protein